MRNILDKKRITITFLIVLTNAVGATAILPMPPVYAEEQFGATPVQAMFVIAAYYAAQFVAASWLGKLSDRFGRRPILVTSQIGTVLSYLLFIFAAPLGDHVGVAFGLSGGPIVVYLARLLDGLTGGNVSVAEAYASDISDEESRGDRHKFWLAVAGSDIRARLLHWFCHELAQLTSDYDLPKLEGNVRTTTWIGSICIQHGIHSCPLSRRLSLAGARSAGNLPTWRFAHGSRNVVEHIYSPPFPSCKLY